MARLLTLDACSVSLRNALLQSLRACDEAILLPQASKSPESQSFKNVVFRLDGASDSVDPSIFSPAWFTGVSMIRLGESDSRLVDELLSTPESRRRALNRMRSAVRSQVADPSVVVGPPLDCDADERDREGEQWIAGFDSASCFVGIFSAEHSKVPENAPVGTNRVHKRYYLVCKAGAGAAAATFHARFLAACSNNACLDSILEHSSSPGPQALRRLSMSSTRNRARIILSVASSIGLHEIQSVPDHAARSASDRISVCHIEVSANVIRKLDASSRSTWQYSTCVDGPASKGLASLSNAGDGVVLFLTSNGESRISLKNDVWGTIPFSSKRISSAKDIALNLTTEYKRTACHPDGDWIRDRFAWTNRVFSDGQPDIEPMALWGSHEQEAFVQCFARELGLDSFQAIRLRPELVVSAGVDSGKLRAIVRNLSDRR
jgi:hypothetical protein